MKIYLASSWRNADQIDVVKLLRAWGHEVYDFRNPEPGNLGFSWAQIDPDWTDWTPPEFRDALEAPVAVQGYSLDKTALDWCEVCVLLLPCGKSAHLEAGYAVGAGKRLVIATADGTMEPELMYRMSDSISIYYSELKNALDGLEDNENQQA